MIEGEKSAQLLRSFNTLVAQSMTCVSLFCAISRIAHMKTQRLDIVPI